MSWWTSPNGDFTSCPRWGRLVPPGTADPTCDCSMCERRRSDIEKATKTKGKKK